MQDNRFPCSVSDKNKSEHICIEANRILDSCRDRDCFEDVKVILTDFGNEIIEHTTSVRAKNACISSTYIGIDPVKFNKGFYAVTIKFFIKITFTIFPYKFSLKSYKWVSKISFLPFVNVGFVPFENLVGKARILFFSHNTDEAWYKPWAWPKKIRFSRMFNPIR